MSARDDAPRATWPPGQEVPEEEVVAARCTSCGLDWRVHRDIAGFRLRCRCGAWVEVAPLARPVLSLPAGDDGPAWVAAAPAAAVVDAVVVPRRADPTRAADPATTSVVLELVALAVAFWGPAFAIQAFAPPDREALLLPLASAVTSLLVLLAGLKSRGDMFAGLKKPAGRYWVEAIGIAAIGAFLAAAYAGWLRTEFPDAEDVLNRVREDAGTPMALFAIALVPAIFEELAFRGLIQGRLARLLDPQQALVITASTFALAHGATAALPIHAAAGFYLCWLRVRSASLLPGMVCHLLYNGALVLSNSA